MIRRRFDSIIRSLTQGALRQSAVKVHGHGRMPETVPGDDDVPMDGTSGKAPADTIEIPNRYAQTRINAAAAEDESASAGGAGSSCQPPIVSQELSSHSPDAVAEASAARAPTELTDAAWSGYIPISRF